MPPLGQSVGYETYFEAAVDVQERPCERSERTRDTDDHERSGV